MSPRLPLVLAALAAATAAEAATQCVKPTGGACQTTIGAAVANAGPGDTITVYAGVYRESVTVRAPLDGLRIVGSGLAVVDPEALVGGTLPAFTIAAPNVSLTNLTVRNGGGDGIVVSGAGVKLSYLKLLGPDGSCVRLDPGADGASLRFSQLRACGGYGVVFGNSTPTKVNAVTVASTTFTGLGDWGINGWGDGLAATSNVFTDLYEEAINVTLGDNAVIKGNTIKSTGCSSAAIVVVGSAASVSYNRLTDVACDGMRITGANALVASNTLTMTYGVGVQVDGATPTIRSNVFSAVYNEAILVLNGGAGATVSYNRIAGDPGTYLTEITADNAVVVGNVMNVGYQGIHVTGDNPTIQSNVMTNVQYGVEVDCSPCNGGLVQSNRVTNVSYTADGFDIVAPGGAGGLRVVSNVVTNATGNCYSLDGLNMTISGNKGFECGSSGGYGFWIRGTGHGVTGNFVRGAVRDGYYVEGSGHTLSTNVADHGTEDGFDIHATGVALDANRSVFNTGSGFEIDATASSATLTGNVVTGGGTIGLCDSGTGTSADPLANSFGSVSTGVACSQANGFIGN